MRSPQKPHFPLDNFFRGLAIALILVAIVVRIAVFLQNRNLFIDEANIARNIYERNLLQLATPLSYEQYAPPVFLWALKLFTFLFGYGEIAFRLYPLLAGIASLVVLHQLLKQLVTVKAIWYPIGLFAVGYMSIRYSTEVKQYMSDVLVVLSLLLLALKRDIATTPRSVFFLTWIVVGSVAIWAAMPSVFALAGVGVYYFWQSVAARDNKKTSVVIFIGLVWMAQFGLYYLIILKPQIETSYLQNFHRDYFLFAIPRSKAEWLHNWYVIKNLIQETAGFWVWAFNFNIFFLIVGAVFLFTRNAAKSMLILVPLVAVLVAAAANQYSLIPRVALFVSPLLLVLIGYGLDVLIRIRPVPVSLILLALCAVLIFKFNNLKMAWERYETEEITDAMNFLFQQRINHGAQLYIDNGARPAFIYYTQIHPEHDRWGRIKDAHLLPWDANYAIISKGAGDTSAYIFTSIDPDELNSKLALLGQHNTQVAKAEKQGSAAYVYRKK